MSLDDPQQPLRMAAPDSSEALAARYEREKRAVLTQRELGLSGEASRFRIGSVPYLNAAPLTRGIEEDVVFVPPVELATRLAAGTLDAALVSVAEVLQSGAYDILDGIAVASLGEVYSVILAHRIPLDRVKEVHCDPASITSVRLLQVLFAERGQPVRLSRLESYQAARGHDAVLLIGDQAIAFRRQIPLPEHEVWDLGAAWMELTGLPFVYAVWALRRGVDTSALRRVLRDAKSFGLDTLDSIIRSRTEFDLDFRKDYLGWLIHYHLGSDEKRGLARFVDLLRKHGIGEVHDPRFVT